MSLYYSFDDFDIVFETVVTGGSPNIKLSLHGKGTLAGAFKELISADELQVILCDTMDRIQNHYLKNEETSTDTLEYLPDYIKCCSSIIYELENISYEQISILQQLIILMVKKYPKISKRYHRFVIESLRLTFLNLHKKGDTKLFNTFTESFVYKSLIWSCSYPPEITENNEDAISYKDFIPLWKKIISLEISDSKIDAADLKEIVKQIFDEIICSVFLFTTKLNLNIVTEENENQMLQKPENKDDMLTFLNMVEIIKELLTPNNIDLFRMWIKNFAKRIIKKSSSSPIISGYYKLLSSCLKMSDYCNYFEKPERKEDILECFQIISKFLEGVISKIQQFSGELQLSCLLLILEAPICFIRPMLPVMAPIFQITFNFGLSYLTIVETSIETLEKWYQYFEPNELKPLLKAVLPYLDPFLRSKGFTGDTDIKSPFTKPKRSKIIVKQHYETESELLKLQRKILMFVGQLDTEISLYLLQNNTIVENVPWEIKPSLNFIVPYEDCKSNIYLDKIVPRIIELALHSGDRKSRISACEILHGIFIVLLSKSRQMSDEQYKYTFEKLFKILIGPLIELGCDSDETVRDIFNELVFQQIHWYTSSSKLFSFESRILIDTLMEGVSHPTNTNLRDFSGKCINEYVEWSIKQYKAEDTVRIYKNIKAIIQKICSYSSHPNSNKRYGAALAFNNIYRKLREEQSMVDRFWIVLFHSFILNLSWDTEKLNSERNCMEIYKTLNHIERVFKEEKILFNQCGYKRKVPEVIEGPFLENIVKWILYNTGSNNSQCRHKCMELFCNLAPCVANCNTAREFLEKNIENEWYIKIYEQKFDNFSVENLNSLTEFLNNLLCCLEGYIWILEQKLLNYNELKTQTLFTALDFYISNITKKSLNEILTEFSSDDTEIFNESKSQIVDKIFSLTLKIIETRTDIPILNNKLWDLLNFCVFEPQTIGFNIINNLETDKLTENNINILNKFNDLPEKYSRELCEMLSTNFNNKYVSITNLDNTHVPNTQRQLLKGLIMIQKSNLKDKVKITNIPWNIKTIFNTIIKGNEGIILTSTACIYLELQLEIALNNKNTLELWECITNNTEITDLENFSKWKSGEYFFNKFKNIILPHLSMNASEVVKNYFRVPKIPSENNGGDILMQIFKYLSENRRNIKINYTNLITDVMKSCENYFVFSETMSLKDREFQIEFLGHIAKLLQKNEPLYKLSVNFSFLRNWFILSLLLEEDDSSTAQTRMIMEFKIRLLNILPCFTGPNDDFNAPLSDTELQKNADSTNIPNLGSTLKQFLNKTVMILSSPRARIATEIDSDAALSNLFSKWLNVLYISKSRLVLECVAELYMKLKNKDVVSKLDEKMVFYFQKLDITHQYKSVDLILNLSLIGDNDCIERYSLANIFLPCMLKHCSYDCFEEFFVRYIKRIIQTIKQNINEESDIKFILQRMIYFILIEILFSRINVSKLNDNSCIINKQLLEDDETKDGLIRVTAKCLLNIRKENYQPNEYTKYLYRIYQCKALNALISLISNTKREVIFYEKFLFDEKVEMWQNLINCDEQIIFPIDFDTIPKMRKIFINIRKEKQTANERKYITAQSILHSSLTEDVFKYDFTDIPLRSQTIEQNLDNYQDVTLESVDINHHECMPTICVLIQHMINNNISPLPRNSDNLPKWLENIQKILLNDNTPVNVKIFFARVIHNMNDIFKNYAKYFFVPIIKVIISCGGNNINYFVADLIKMLLQWPDSTILENEKKTVTELTHFLMKNAHSDRRDILKYNLEIIKTMFNVWKQYLDTSDMSCLPEPISILLIKSLKGSTMFKNTTIQLIGIVLANKIMPWNKANVESYILTFDNILYDDKSDYKSLSEVIGMSLNVMNENGWSNEFNSLEKRIKRFLTSEHNKKRYDTRSTKFVHCLEHIQIHYPKIINEFIDKIYKELMNNMNNNAIVTICLKNILRYIETTKKLRTFEQYDFKKLLNSSEEEIQILTLQIINKNIELSGKSILKLLDEITNFKMSTNTNIREAMYNIFITVHKKYSEDDDLIKKSRSVLLSGLIDTDQDIQNKIQLFWTDKELLPNKLNEIYKKLLTNYYSTDTELYYLGYSVYFLLEGSKHSTDYDKQLNEYQLKDGKYEKYDINLTKSRSSTFTPLFFDSYASQFGNVTQLQGVRNTNTLKYAETQSLRVLKSTQNTSSFLFNTNLTLSSDLFDENYVTTEKQVNYKTIVRPSGRFLNDKGKIRNYFANREVYRNIKRDEFRRERIKRKDAAIAIYRDYTKGDFPDIQIKYSDIIKPLQALSRRDGIIARHLYVMLFNGLIKEMQNEQSSEYLNDIHVYITKVFEETIIFEPKLIAALFDLYLEYKKHMSIEPDRLVILSKNSGLLSTGSLLLEEQIMNKCETNGIKKGVGSKNSEEYQWAKLADLYKEGHNWDGVAGIFSKKETIDYSNKELILQAILEESKGLWKKASDSYKQLIESDPSNARKDFYYESYFKCYAHLSDWDGISDYINNEISFDRIWEGGTYEENILPWFFTAGVYVTLEKQTNTHILQFLHNSMIDSEKSKYIKNKFSEELSILSLIQNDIAASNYYIENYLSIFLSDWSNINPLFIKTRTNKLINLQKITDINNFLIFNNTINNSNAENKISNIIKNCNKYNDMSTQSFIVSEMKTVYRKYLTKKIENTVSQFSEDTTDFNSELHKIAIDANFSFINYALSKNNYLVAQKYIKKCENIKPDEGENGIKLSLLQCKSVLLQSENLPNETKIEKLTYWWSHLDLLIRNNKKPTNLLIESIYLAHKYSKVVNEVLQYDDKLLDINEFVGNLRTGKLVTKTENTNILQQYSMNILRYGIKLGERETNKIKKSKYGKDLSDAYMNLILYLQKLNCDEYNDEIIKYVLRAMKFGNDEARQLFPYILKILEKSVSFEQFKSEASTVPTWMFISWIPQLLANLNTNRSNAVEEIILKIAKTYPQAIMYPYQLSKEKFTSNNDSQFMIDLDSILNNPTLEKFTFALSSVCVPELNLKYYLQMIIDSKDQTELKNAVKDFENDIYIKVNTQYTQNSLSGRIFESLKPICESIKHVLSTTPFEGLKEKLTKAEFGNVVTLSDKKEYSTFLKDYSPWLANFGTLKSDFEFEIPGQYTGDRKPLVQHHVKLSSFGENVQVFKKSIRKPIKITMLGNDSKDYIFFIKFGEDLRQDQRIQQLFTIANSILENDSDCLQRNLLIETYNVIPLKHNVGLIECVTDTKSFRNFIFDVLEDNKKNECIIIREDYRKWIQSAPKIKNGDKSKLSYCYNNSCIAYNREQVTTTFRKFVNVLPWDILRQAFWSISMDVENFTSLRQQFITSYSTMCIIHWLLGISDRHLDNILICQNTGRAVGIDFGYAFDIGTRNLPIPELIPFRLTPHILNLTEPLKEKGFIEFSMIHCLKALRKQKHILLSTMDVFVNEPAIGWIEIAQNRAQEKEIDIFDSFIPSEKILNAQKKLDGINPMMITIQELEQGALRNERDYLRTYINVVKGENNERKKAKDDGLTVEEQVTCLIEQATDENILGRAFDGFEPWI